MQLSHGPALSSSRQWPQNQRLPTHFGTSRTGRRRARTVCVRAVLPELSLGYLLLQVPTPAAPTAAATSNIVSRGDCSIMPIRAPCCFFGFLSMLRPFLLTAPGSKHPREQPTTGREGASVSSPDRRKLDRSSSCWLLFTRQEFRKELTQL